MHYNGIVIKRKFLIVFGIFAVIAFSLASFSLNVFATDIDTTTTPTPAKDKESSHITETMFFGNMKDDGSACGVFSILNLVVDIFSIGVTILALIGVNIVGIKYLTAGGNTAQTEKAKHRMFQIVIGIVVYAALYVGVQWLMPGGKLDFGKRCTTVSQEELAKIKEKEKAEAEAQRKKNEEDAAKMWARRKEAAAGKGGTTLKNCMKNAAPAVRDKICKIQKPAERIAATAKLLAGSSGSPTQAYKDAMSQTHGNSEGECESTGESCNTFVATTLLASGVDPNVPRGDSNSGNNTRVLYDYFLSSSKWKKISNDPYASREGDVVIKPRPSGHVTLTVKDGSGNLVTAHASLCGFYPIIGGSIYTGYSGTPTVFRYVGD